MKYQRTILLAASALVALGTSKVQAQTTTTTAPATTTTSTTSNQMQNTQQTTQPTNQSTLQNQQQNLPKITIGTPTSGLGSATSAPSNANPLVATYGDWMSLGMPSQYANGRPSQFKVSFGKGLYTATTTTSNTQTANTSSQTAHGFTTYGTVRNPAYATGLSDDMPRVVHQAPALQSTVRSMIERSNYIKSKGTVGVTVNGSTVELSGVVATEKERRTVEGMVRMTPGVREVVNQLQVAAPK